MNSNLNIKSIESDLINMDRTITKENLNKNNKPTIVLMTRWHAIFRCKSRLSRDIGALKASKIQEKLTNHTIEVAKEIQRKGLADIKVAIHGIGIQAAKKWAHINKVQNFSIQGTGSLGTKMKRQFLKTQSEKAMPRKFPNSIILIGTDLPCISSFDLIQALDILTYKEMVIGPSADGGYWLIGLSNKLLNPICIWPFSGISWGTDKVLKETINLATLNRIDYQLLQTKNDLDNILDLSSWLDYKSFQLSASSYQL
tara:strand:- start:202 stop:969 length:768 start_codon:yes stop_codon:yes gene_type:complete